MKKLIYLLVCIVFYICNANPLELKDLKWIKTFGSYSWDEKYSTAIDKSGNIYITGITHSDSINFGNGKWFYCSDTSNGSTFFLVKFNNEGQCQWIKTTVGHYSDIIPKNICIDNSGNILIIGWTVMSLNNVDFGNGKVISVNNGVNNIIFLKYSADGDCLFATCFNTYRGVSCIGDAVCSDMNDNIYLTGYMDNADFGNAVVISTNNSTYQAPFIAKFDKGGLCQWAKKFKAKDTLNFVGEPAKIKLGSDNSLILCGKYYQPTDFGDGNFIDKTNKTSSGSSIFVANYTLDGLVNWVKVFGDSADFSHDMRLSDIAVDKNNNFFFSGSFYQNGYLSPGFYLNHYADNLQADMFLAKCNPKGEIIWAKSFGGDSADYSASLYLEDYNNLYYTGTFNSDELDFGSFKLDKPKNTPGICFFALFDSSGNAKGLNYLSSGNTVFQMDIFEDNNKNIFLSADFMDSIATNKSSNISNGSYDIFIAKYGSLCDISSFSYPDFSDTKSLNLVYSATKKDSVISLTSNKPFDKGALWYNPQIPVANGFTTEFQFRFSHPYNAFDDGSLPGADGLAFVIQNAYPKACGTNGGGIGFEGIANSLAVEFDTYKNEDSPYNDADGNHIAVFSNGKLPNTANHKSSANLGTTNKILPIKADSTIYHAKIEYNSFSRKLDVYLDTTGSFKKPVLTIDSLNLSKFLDLQNGTYAFMGFTSATGTSYENQDILAWTICLSASGSITAVEENNINPVNNDFIISPNPATCLITLNIPPEYQSSQIKIYSVEGIEVYSEPYEGLKPSESYKIDVTGFAPGVYYVKVRDKVCRFVKM